MEAIPIQPSRDEEKDYLVDLQPTLDKRNKDINEKGHPEDPSSPQDANAASPIHDDPTVVDWNSDQDTEYPLNWTSLRRWSGVGIVSTITCVV
jgi:hypothetical protein